MPTNLNYTQLDWTLVPRSWQGTYPTGWTGGDLADATTADAFGNFVSNVSLHSANAPILYQLEWTNNYMSDLDEGTGAGGERIAGDLVNVVFEVYMNSPWDFPNVTLGWPGDWRKIATIRKAKDIAIVDADVPGAPISIAPGHRFTIDIAPICADFVSYSLAPINSGCWGGYNDGTTGPQGGGSPVLPRYGGMNGQWTQQSIITGGGSPMSRSLNGTLITVRVMAKFEVLKTNGGLELAQSPYSKSTLTEIQVCNEVPQWSDTFNLKFYQITGNNETPDRMFLSNCPNGSTFKSLGAATSFADVYKLKVRADDHTQWLQFFINETLYQISPNGERCQGIALRVDISDDNGATWPRTRYLVDFSQEERLRRSTFVSGGVANGWAREQNLMCVQNVSPQWIELHNNGDAFENAAYFNASYNAGAITSSTTHYRVSVVNVTDDGSGTDFDVEYKVSEYRYFEIDREPEHPYGYVKFFWINRKGGIDSYYAKRNVTQSIQVEQNTIERKASWRRWIRNNGTVGQQDDSIGGNMYPHGREVLNVNANKSYSVYTDPMTVPESEWLEEILTSPNVWIQANNKGSNWINYVTETITSSDTRPSVENYYPVLITNGDSVLVDQSQGLVQMNIEFTESYQVNSQRT